MGGGTVTPYRRLAAQEAHLLENPAQVVLGHAVLRVTLDGVAVMLLGLDDVILLVLQKAPEIVMGVRGAPL